MFVLVYHITFLFTSLHKPFRFFHIILPFNHHRSYPFHSHLIRSHHMTTQTAHTISNHIYFLYQISFHFITSRTSSIHYFTLIHHIYTPRIYINESHFLTKLSFISIIIHYFTPLLVIFPLIHQFINSSHTSPHNPTHLPTHVTTTIYSNPSNQTSVRVTTWPPLQIFSQLSLYF